MLENLHVKNLALIKEAEVDFKEGFNVLTGETGAGKSIILGSINLALGAKAGTDIIRNGADSALVEMSFSLPESRVNKIKEMDLPIEDDGYVLLTRKIMPNKSVCRMNGETITAHQLRELSGILINMYGQHEHQSLLKSATYSRMLDEYAGESVLENKATLSGLLKEYKSLLKDRDSENADDGIRARQIELLEYEINEIETAALKVGEDEELEKRYRFLLNARKIMENVSEVHSITGYDNELSAGGLIGRAVNKLRMIGDLDEEAANLLSEVSQIEDLLNDFNRSLTDYEDKLVFDEAEFAEIEERLNVINHLKDKYGGSVENVLNSLEDKSDEIEKLRNFEEYLKDLDSKIDTLKKKSLKVCKDISETRKKSSGPLVDKLMAAMKDLNFQDVNLSINIESDEESITESGFDNIEFLISLNTGEELKPLQNVASGGELSRIMLAFKSVFADRDDVSTLIFDEIDTGISGVTAYKVAEKMRELAKNHQLICITHLPQIAAMADEHFLISKSVSEGRTESRIELLDEDSSTRELARMLSGDEITDSAIKAALDLKGKKK